MPLAMPNTTPSQGNTVLIVLDAPPAATNYTLAELNAGTFITCHVYGDFSAPPNQSVGESPRKMCKKVNPQRLGNVTYTISDVQYSYFPQGLNAPGEDGNEAMEALPEGAERWLIELPGVDGETSALQASTGVYNKYHVECGVQRRGRTGDGEYDEFSITQSFVMWEGAEPEYDKSVPAA